VIYFLLVFAVGWILGPIRELWAVPYFGRVAAMLLEAVIMLIAMIVSSRWVMRRFNVPRTLPATIAWVWWRWDIATRRDRGCSVGAWPISPGISCELHELTSALLLRDFITVPGERCPTGLGDRQSLGGPGPFGDAWVIAFDDVSRAPQLVELAVLTTAGRDGEHEK
jgi:hypothetical protein